MHTISNVLPVYNSQSSLSHCIESILKQKNFHELIIINDGSDDYSQRIIDFHKKGKYGNQIVVVMNEKRKGGAHSRNVGNRLATGDIIAVCDCDFYYRNRNEVINEFFEKEDKDIFYSGLHYRPFNTTLEQYKMDAFEWDFKSKCPISHPTVAYKRNVAINIHYLEQTIDSDLYEFFLLDAHASGYTFGACNEALMLKVEGGSKRNAKEAKKFKKEMYKQYGVEI